MVEIPLFPLNTVLFPNMPLPLRIFETRYQEMLRFCLANKSPFGVGTTAEIVQVQPHEGQSLIVTMGMRRFRIVTLKRERPYLTADVEYIPLMTKSIHEATRLASALQPLVWVYLQKLNELDSTYVELDQFPPDAKTFANLAAGLIQIDNLEKQNLLEEDETAGLLKKLTKLYKRELVLLRTLPTHKDDLAPFSLN
jgi:Lon protease-like protein